MRFDMNIIGPDPEGWARVEFTLPLVDRTLINPMYYEWRRFRSEENYIPMCGC